MSTVADAPKLQDHIVFQMLLKHFNEGTPSFKAHTDGEAILKKGFLFQAAGLIDSTSVVLEHQTKSQVIRCMKGLEQKIQGYQIMEQEIKKLIKASFIKILLHIKIL